MNRYDILNEIKDILIGNNLSLSTAESCTGGLVSSYLTDVSGASNFIFQNFVTYSNLAKEKYLNVSNKTLKKYGAVSENTAYEMIEGLLKLSDCAIITTGILGPTGGSEDKPIGLVYIGLGFKNKDRNKIKVVRYISKKAGSNERHKIKKDIAKKAISEFLDFIKENVKNGY